MGNSPFFQTAQGQAIDAVLSDLTAQDVNANGAIVSVTCPQGRWTQAFGDAAAGQVLMNKNMPFRIASNTKIFTAMAVLRLIDMGVIHPNDPIQRYIRNPYPANLANWDSITIQELADHTSGLSDFDTSTSFLNAKNGSPYASWTPLQVLSYVQDLNYLPGAQFTYANTNYVILGMLVEAVTGQSLASFVHQQFSVPLGLSHTGSASSGSNPPLDCRGYSGSNDVTLDNPTWVIGAGDMVSTVADLTTWMRAVGSGSLLSPSSQSLLINEVIPTSNTGFGIQEHQGWIGHTGRINGYSSACFYNDSLKATVVVMVNREDGTDGTNKINREVTVLNDVITRFFPNNPTGLVADPDTN